jgi:prephenate dehydrogenase
MTIGIVGLGLIGGSLGLALQNTKLVSKVLGYDHNLTNCEDALELNLIHEIVSFDEIKKCDIIFLAIPVEAIIKTLGSLEDIAEHTTIVDLGSTKDEIIKSVPVSIRSNFVAAHPMAGTEKFGPNAAFQTLYQNKIVVFCDTKESSDFHKDRAIQIFSHIGMKIVFMDGVAHDKHASFISHLPHAISYALANTVIGQEDPKSILLLAGGGFESMSRLAKSSPTMWSEIFKQNRENLLTSLELFEKELSTCKEMIKDEKWNDLENWMGDATTIHKIL